MSKTLIRLVIYTRTSYLLQEQLASTCAHSLNTGWRASSKLVVVVVVVAGGSGGSGSR